MYRKGLAAVAADPWTKNPIQHNTITQESTTQHNATQNAAKQRNTTQRRVASEHDMGVFFFDDFWLTFHFVFQ